MVPAPEGAVDEGLNQDGTERAFYQVDHLPYILDRHPDDSPIARTVDAGLGDSRMTLSLGLRGSGKSWEGYYRLLDRYETERLIIRQTLDDWPWHLFGRPGVEKMIFWLPSHLDAKAYQLERDQPYDQPAQELPLRVEHYLDVDDFLERARPGVANVWGGDRHVLRQGWIDLLRALRYRRDTRPQIVSDDEVHEIAPNPLYNADKRAHAWTSEFLELVADFRKAEVALTLCSQQGHRIHPGVAPISDVLLFMPGAKVPDWVTVDFREILRNHPIGKCVAYGLTNLGPRYEELVVPPPPRRRFRVFIDVRPAKSSTECGTTSTATATEDAPTGRHEYLCLRSSCGQTSLIRDGTRAPRCLICGTRRVRRKGAPFPPSSLPAPSSSQVTT